MVVNHLIINDYGGAGRAAVRISSALEQSIVSTVYCAYNSTSSNCKTIRTTFQEKVLRKMANRLNRLIVKRYGNVRYFCIDNFGISYKDDRFLDADVINLHFVNFGIWSDSFVKKLLMWKKPIVWTLHDMWPFTGGCQYNGTCFRYYGACGKCPILHSNDENDLSHKSFLKKMMQLESLNVQFVGCSSWISEEANKSSIGKTLHKTCVNIPNPVDKRFHCLDKERLKEEYGLQGKKVILFGASSSLDDSRKGFFLLKKVFERLDPSKYVLLFFGSNLDENELRGHHVLSLGRLFDDEVLCKLYNVADVFLAPSLQENLANVVIESLSCGTPVIAFRVGGMRDMILDGKNGFLITPYDVSEFVDRLECVAELHNQASISADVYERFSPSLVAYKYINLYKSLIENNKTL